MAEKRDSFAARLLRLEQEIATYRQVHEEELAELHGALETLRQEFLNQDHQRNGAGVRYHRGQAKNMPPTY